MNETELMLTTVLGCRRVDLVTGDVSLTEEQQRRLEAMKKRRQSGEPLQYVLGFVDFMGLELRVDPYVLIPRPETEILVEAAIKELQAKAGQSLKILDLGTGSGNIAVTLAQNIENAHVTAVDISPAALAVAALNIKRHDVQSRVSLVCQDMEIFLKENVLNKSSWDMIVTNPPYVPSGNLSRLPADVRREPSLALDGGKDGLDYFRSIFSFAPALMPKGGLILTEIGDGQYDKVADIIKRSKKYGEIKSLRDYVGTPRIIITSKNI